MTKKIRVAGRLISLTDKEYLASGGEGEVYLKGSTVYKLYHDPKNKTIPAQKIQELSVITNDRVVLPQNIIYDDKSGASLGYTTDFIDSSDPLLKLFNRAFKTANSITPVMIAELVKWMQLVTIDIHRANCLLVDYNELNVLVKMSSGKLTPFYIDTDSYATPSFKATAIMDSVRDRKATTYDSKGQMHYHPTITSDWFSWGVLAFWLYTNVHAFRGNHPDYKPKDKHKQMDDGISVFHKGVRVPPTVEDFNIIPKRHLDWFKLVFERGDRSIPPVADATVPLLVPAQIITITGTDKLGVDQVAACGSPIISVQQFMGVNYVVTKEALYSGNNRIRDNGPSKKVFFCPASGGSMITATRVGNTIEFAELYSGEKIDTIRSPDLFERNGAIYTVTNGTLVENTFVPIGLKLTHRIKVVENVSTLTTKIYPGCLIQDLLGKKYLTLPYALGRSFSKYLPGLDHVRILDAKSDKNVTVIIGEEKGQYNRYVIVFDRKYQTMDIRVDEDVPYEPINFAVLDNGLCLLLSATDQIQLFSTAAQYETLDDPPFDSSMPLFSTPKGFFFINGNSIHQLKRK